MSDRTLIKNGFVLTMDADIGDFDDADVLIVDGKIAEVRPHISADDAEIVDAKGMIVTPGLFDAHRHCWQTQLRTTATDWTLSQYFVNMRARFSAFYEPEDVYIGNYVGLLEALDAGITSCVDHSHIINTPDHADAGVEAFKASGARGIYCYGFFKNPKYKIGEPIDLPLLVGDMFGDVEEWRYKDAERIKLKHFSASDGKIRFGIAPNELEFRPYPESRAEFRRARDLDPIIYSLHAGMGRLEKDVRLVKLMQADGFLDEKCLFVHAAGFSDEELQILVDHGSACVSSPDTELGMGMGFPLVSQRIMKLGGKTSLGVDIVSNIAGDLFAQMRLNLQVQRAVEHAVEFRRGYMPGDIPLRARDVLELATIGGAKAVGLDRVTGSITPGKDADITMFDCHSINMTPVIDPYGAIIFNANIHDVHTVMVCGKLVKRNGKLVGVDWEHWRKKIVASSEKMMSRSRHVPIDKIGPLFQNMFNYDADEQLREDATVK